MRQALRQEGGGPFSESSANASLFTPTGIVFYYRNITLAARLPQTSHPAVLFYYRSRVPLRRPTGRRCLSPVSVAGVCRRRREEALPRARGGRTLIALRYTLL